MNAAKQPQPAMTPSARNDRLYAVLLGPVVSEKSTMIGEKHEQVAFRVKHDATKTEVKAAIELLFKVQVDRVSILNQKGKRSASAALRAGVATCARRMSG